VADGFAAGLAPASPPREGGWPEGVEADGAAAAGAG